MQDYFFCSSAMVHPDSLRTGLLMTIKPMNACRIDNNNNNNNNNNDDDDDDDANAQSWKACRCRILGLRIWAYFFCSSAMVEPDSLRTGLLMTMNPMMMMMIMVMIIMIKIMTIILMTILRAGKCCDAGFRLTSSAALLWCILTRCAPGC